VKRTLIALMSSAVVAGLLAGAGVSAQAAEPVRPAAKAPIVSGTPEEFLAQIPPVEPIMAGYKGTSSFIPPAVAKGKDKRGCNMRQRMLIEAAYTKPKVGKKCALTGGVWWVDGGTKKVTKAKDVAFTTALTLAQAWGQGASQWTPAQRQAWATQVQRTSPAPTVQTRAREVTGLAATQQIISAETLAKAAEYKALEDRKIQAAVYTIYCNRGLFTLAALATNSWLISICSMKPDDVIAILNADDALERICWQTATQILNVTSWGLSLPPQEIERMNAILATCREDGYGFTSYYIEMASEEYGIRRVPSPTTVTTEVVGPDGVASGGSVVTLPFTDYSGSPTSGVISRGLFGVAAPVDWGDPGVPTGYLRLWDAGVSWRQMQPEKDKPIDWSKLDATMEMASRIGAKVMYVLGDTPGWANGGKSGATPPTNLDDAANFISQVCTRYRNSTPITSYEVWNEGNLTTFWTGSMADLAKVTQKVKQSVSSCGSGQVFASSTGTRATNAFATNYPEYLRELAKLMWPVDGYTVHSYPAASGGPTQRIEEIAQFKTLLAQNGAPVRPILDTELNYGLAGLGQDRRVIDPATGAAYISQSFIQSVQYGVDSLFWFLWTQADYDKLGIQLNAGTPQTIQAWKQTQEWLAGQAMTRCAVGAVVQACQMTGPKGNYTLLWTNAGEVSVSVAGLGSTVQYLDGTSLPIGASKTIGLGIAPVAVRP
jgi:polysaccharide biosynthesis protein PslG